MIGQLKGMECAARFSRRSLARVRAIRASVRETIASPTIPVINVFVHLLQPWAEL